MRFDRFVSVGVHEHAGYSLKQYRLWAEAIAAALKEGGLGVVSTTSWMVRQMTGLLTLKYIFPGGHVPSLPDTLVAFDRAGLMLVEVESLWPHYQRTMDEWRKNFAKGWSEIQQSDPGVFTETFRRRWTMYLEGTGEAFGDFSIFPISFRQRPPCGLFPSLSLISPNGGPIHLRRSGTGVL